jgi:uncharacterized delta-60 repeat protein
MGRAAIWIVATMAAALLALAPTASANLDPSYGDGGRVMVPLEHRVGASVLMPDGGLVFSSGQALWRLTSDGQPDTSFGAGGSVTPPAPPGGSFTIAGLAVDSQDRLLVAGTAETKGSDERATVAGRVMRYLPSGVLDQGFGEGGVVETRFGLPPAPGEAEPPAQTGAPFPPANVVSPAIEVSGVAVDGEDRIVLTGGASDGFEFGCAHDWFWYTRTYAAFVARLTAAGAPDPDFSGDGVFGGQSGEENPLTAEVSADPVIGPDGSVTYSRGRGSCPNHQGRPGMARLDAAGATELTFGRDGAVRKLGEEPAIAPDGTTFALAWTGPWFFTKEALHVRVVHLNSSGAPIRSYGHGGQSAVLAAPGGPGSSFGGPVLDGRGGVLLGGTMVTAKAAKKRQRRFLSLVRLRPNGRLDRRFGPRGKLAVGFGSAAVSISNLLLDPQGRALLVGAYRYPNRAHGLVVARFTLAH